MGSIVNFCKTNPVRAMGVLNTLIVLAVSFGAHLTNQQIVAVTGFAAALLGMSGELVRANVTPMATLPDHVAAAVVTAANQDVQKTDGTFVKPVTYDPNATGIVQPTSIVQLSSDGASSRTLTPPTAPQPQLRITIKETP